MGRTVPLLSVDSDSGFWEEQWGKVVCYEYYLAESQAYSTVSYEWYLLKVSSLPNQLCLLCLSNHEEKSAATWKRIGIHDNTPYIQPPSNNGSVSSMKHSTRILFLLEPPVI